ncbi:hypothetical protein L1049_001536 [Liquidambar formosana]|uniref:Fe2OG dioxygenase domain-containing protein n=1 Tax=Liquidambar formosana TaxID=63359 RepID=A0AAP0R698_LIQFO
MGSSNYPESHTWTLSGTYPSLDPVTAESVPVIDLNDPNAISLIRHASEKWGVFQVTNHGIPMALIEEVEFEARRLFTLPTERKLLAVRSPDGLTGYGLARISNFFPKLMWYEGFSIVGSPVEHARQLWPHDHTKFCNVIEEVPERVCPDPGHAMGLAPHTDSSLVTLLYQSSTNGLQVLKDNMGWVTVQPLKGAIVVNVGPTPDFHSSTSMAHPETVKISPSMKLTDSDHPPLYRQVSWKEYLDAKAKHFDKALGLIRSDVLAANM